MIMSSGSLKPEEMNTDDTPRNSDNDGGDDGVTATDSDAAAAILRLGQRMMAELELKSPAGSSSSSTSSSSSEDESDTDANAETDTDAGTNKYKYPDEGPYDPDNYMLNALRNGMNTVHSMARKTLAKCKTEKIREETACEMKAYTLGLLRRERTFTESFGICTQIIDDIMAEEDEEGVGGFGDGADAGAADHNWDKKPLLPYTPTVEGLTKDRARMNQMFDDRMAALENTLTDDKLSSHPRFVALEKQIALSSKEFHENLEKQTELDKKLEAAPDDDDAYLAILMDSWRDRLHTTSSGQGDYEDEVHDDNSATEYVDPITKRPIRNPARNLHCRHVFDKASIQNFINKSPGTARCPVPGCTNETILKMEDFLHLPPIN